MRTMVVFAALVACLSLDALDDTALAASVVVDSCASHVSASAASAGTAIIAVESMNM
jgi:hypothetical protein